MANQIDLMNLAKAFEAWENGFRANPEEYFTEETRYVMPSNVNCTSFRNGKCLHQAAPAAFFARATCILIDQERQDPRLHLGCALCTPHERPDYPYRPTQPKPSGPPNAFDKLFVPQPQRH